MASLNVRDLGDFIRDQRRTAQISLRQLARQAGVSNPYLSQIERGLRKPSAEILAQIAKALRISAEVLYVQAGFLEEREGDSDVVDAILKDEGLTERQRQVILEIYEAFRRENASGTGSDAEAVAAGSTRAGVPAAEVAGAVGATIPTAKVAPRTSAKASTARGATRKTPAPTATPAKSPAAKTAAAKTATAKTATAKTATAKTATAKTATAKSSTKPATRSTATTKPAATKPAATKTAAAKRTG